MCQIQILYNPQAPFFLTLTGKVVSSSIEWFLWFSPKHDPVFTTTCQKQLVHWTEQRSEGDSDVKPIQEEGEMCERKMNAGKERALTVRGFSLKRRPV